MVAFPTLREYQEALQFPDSFTDPDLQRARAQADANGLPRVRSGGFALTYLLENGSQKWAVRCFKQPIPRIGERYAAIERFLGTKAIQTLLPVEYQDSGLFVGDRAVPIVKMAWFAGRPLNHYVQRHLGTRAIPALAETFRVAIRELDARGVVHGDLQHGNILVADDGSLRFIDYDGMVIPGAGFDEAYEIGHVDYQHPRRGADDIGPEVDRFAAIAIHMALSALASDSSLWREFDTGDNLLFRAEDFRSPLQSALLRRIAGLAGMGSSVSTFLTYLPDLSRVPSLDAFLEQTGDAVESPVAAFAGEAAAGFGPVRAARVRQYDVIDAGDNELVLARVGDRVEVVGRIVAARRAFTRTGQPYVFLNFGDFHDGCCTLVLWREGVEAFEDAGIDPLGLKGQWVSVIGLVQEYVNHSYGTVFSQIVIEDPSEIRLLANAEKARSILAEAVTRGPIHAGGTRRANQAVLDRMNAARTRPSGAQTGTRNQQVLNRMNRPTRPAATAPPTRKAPSSSCFIATAAFGSPMEPEVVALRDWRDRALTRTPIGRALVRIYYATSPPIAAAVRRSHALRCLVRGALALLLRVLKK